MNQTIETIVDFERPPVVEVVLGTQFDQPVVDLEALSEFAVAVKDAFPGRQQLDPLPTAAEPFSRPPQQSVEIRLGGPPLPRTWFLSADERLLVQLQSDRLILNWRRVAVGDEYPRYKALRPKFDELRETLRGILAKLGRPAPQTNHVEVSYSNELLLGSWNAPDAHPPLSTFLTTVCEPPSAADSFLPAPEDTTYGARYRIHHATSREVPAGRLVVITDAAYRTSDLRPIYLLRLSAYLVGTFTEEGEITETLDRGREWVVKGFLDMVKPEIQRDWGPTS